MAVLEQRYAKALLEAALAQGEAAAVASRLDGLAEALEDGELRSFLFNPRTAKADKLTALQRICGGLEGPLGNFLQVVVDRRREACLPRICTIYHRLQLAALGAVEGVVETAMPLSPDAVAGLSSALAKALGKKEVILEVRERPDLLGGVRVRVAGRIYDASALGRLAELRRRLLGVPL